MTSNSGEWDHIFKILFVGDSGVGKSSLLLRTTEDKFYDEQTPTIGVDFKQHMFLTSGKRINLTIWDTAGQEKFRSLTTSYYRGTQGIILVYDITSEESFSHVFNWLEEVEIHSSNVDVVKVLVGNKLDQERKRVVTKERAMSFAKEKKLIFGECSSKTGEGVREIVEEMVKTILNTPAVWSSSPVNKVTIAETSNNSSWCPC
eukprot:TRINITY_DN8453_c0_g1_i1.p1 TRINITY_DN8453_c0_g1~~TRINITY_DN8453_c0_g1_i1.p1  ORF type:complete len:213 (-),score=45.66 TRINITY_DN8453_c0_g1_i1:57-665(-)